MQRRFLSLGIVYALLGPCGCVSSLPEASEERAAPLMPEGLAEPGRRIWEGDRETWQLMSSGFLSPITDVVVQPPNAGPNQILIVGPYGAFTTGQFPEKGHTVSFEDPGDESVAWEVQAIDLDGDGANEFVNRGGNWHPVSAFGSDGRIVWRQALEWGANQMASGDLDGDGRPDFVIGMNGRDGLRRIDSQGRQIWKVPGSNIWDVELTDLDGNGRDEILYSGSRGLSIRNADGSLFREVPLDPSPFHFEIVRWPDLRIVYARGESLWLASPDGSVSASYPIGFNPGLGDLRARVFAASGRGTALAVLIDSRLHDRSVLNLYDNVGKLFYQEVLPWSCPELEVLETGDPDGDVLLLGCNGWLALHGPYLPLWYRSLAFIESAEGPDSSDLFETLLSLSWALVHKGRPEEALVHATRAEAIARSAPERSGNRLANALSTLGFVKCEMHRNEEARADLEAALRLTDRAEPDADRLTRDIHYNLGSVFYANGEMAEAERHYLKSLDGGLPNPYPADRAKSAYNLARVYLRQGRREEAERMARMAVENDLVAYSADHEQVAKDLRLLSEILPSGAEPEDLIPPPASSADPR